MCVWGGFIKWRWGLIGWRLEVFVSALEEQSYAHTSEIQMQQTTMRGYGMLLVCRAAIYPAFVETAEDQTCNCTTKAYSLALFRVGCPTLFPMPASEQ